MVILETPSLLNVFNLLNSYKYVEQIGCLNPVSRSLAVEQLSRNHCQLERIYNLSPTWE